MEESMADDERAHNRELPEYGTKPKKPGLYLGLFHGRETPMEKMDGWGFNGPAIGPLSWVHTTYAADIKIEFENAEDAELYFGSMGSPSSLSMDSDMLVFRGLYYGDWTVYYVGAEDCERPADSFRSTKRINALHAHNRVLL
jgi:hypothetical protein